MSTYAHTRVRTRFCAGQSLHAQMCHVISVLPTPRQTFKACTVNETFYKALK